MIFIFIILKQISQSTIISKSNLEKCNQFQNSTSLLKNCKSKILLSLSIENGKLDETESIEAYVTKVIAEDTIKQLQNPYKITIKKSPVYIEYPAIYVQDFNFKPREQIILTDIFSCSDGDLSPNPTCGWAYLNKSIIPYSQGFCCKCDFGQVIGIDTTSRKRGSTCEMFNVGSGSASAHCLNYDSLWYSAYEIKSYIINYTIDVIIAYQINNNYEMKTLKLSPSDRITVSDDDNILARIIGDFNPISPPIDYSSFYLIMPSKPETHSMVMEGPINWMIVPKNLFTLDGRECDKIGISYYAFRSQSNSCSMKIGDCLHNQIYDLYNSDLELITQSKSPKYLLYSKSYEFYSYSKDQKKFSYKANGVYNTLITLELIADDIRYIINVSQGIIDSAILKTFEAMSNDGVIDIQISNVGNLTASFNLNFYCSDYILPIEASEVSLKPLESYNLKKDVFSLNQDFRSHVCNITLKNSIGDITDYKLIKFNTSQTIFNNNQNFNNNVIENDNLPSMRTPDYQLIDCNQLCPGLFEFLCFLAHSCFGLIARTIGLILVFLILLIILIRCIKNRSICGLINKLCDYMKKTNLYEQNKILKKKQYINFFQKYFDFSGINIKCDFSVEAYVLYYNKNNQMDITDITFANSFEIIRKSYYSIDLSFNNLLLYIRDFPGFITDNAIFELYK